MRLLGLAAAFSLAACSSSRTAVRTFTDRQVAWHEHDDASLAKSPAKRKYLKGMFVLRDDVFAKLDHLLALGFDPTPAEDVNALDEVPCSSWYCPRNHLRQLSAAEIAAGPPEGHPPVKPFRAVEGKTVGATPGFIIEDATGTRYILKIDSAEYFNLQTGAEVVGSRLAHAAGWHVPSTYAVDFRDDELIIDPKAMTRDPRIRNRRLAGRVPLSDIAPRMLAGAARGPDGRVRASASQWLEGDIIGPFEFKGRRGDDPNDRILHERRRSLRASWLLMAWLGNADGPTHNTLDVVVGPKGQGHVRHYQTDWATSFGSWSLTPKQPYVGREARLPYARMAHSVAALGMWERDWERDYDQVYAAWREHPSVGYFPGKGWDPEGFRTIGFAVAHRYLTARDAYWAAKVITSFTNEQIDAAVAAGRYPEGEARYLNGALRARRDIIGRRYLTTYAAVERPTVAGDRVCFTDIARERGYVPRGARYEWRLMDRTARTLARGTAIPPTGARGCLAPGLRGDYAVLSLKTLAPGRGASKASHVHLRWRAAEQRWVVVGIDRDE